MLMNYIALEPGKPLLMHFSDYYEVRRQIADNERGGLKWVDSKVFWVDTLEGEPVARSFSILSTNLAAKLEPFLADRRYLKYDFRITKVGLGYGASFIVEALPRAGASSV